MLYTLTLPIETSNEDGAPETFSVWFSPDVCRRCKRILADASGGFARLNGDYTFKRKATDLEKG
jgi:hypothetical protein